MSKLQEFGVRVEKTIRPYVADRRLRMSKVRDIVDLISADTGLHSMFHNKYAYEDMLRFAIFCAQLDLRPGVYHEVWAVPFKIKGRTEIKAWIGREGWKEMCRREGVANRFYMEAVHEKDTYIHPIITENGYEGMKFLPMTLENGRPAATKARGDIVGGFAALYNFKDDGTKEMVSCAYMDIDEIHKRRDNRKGNIKPEYDPWVKWYKEMVPIIPFRKAIKSLKVMNTPLNLAINSEDKTMREVVTDDIEVEAPNDVPIMEEIDAVEGEMAEDGRTFLDKANNFVNGKGWR